MVSSGPAAGCGLSADLRCSLVLVAVSSRLAEIDPVTMWRKFGGFTSYFDRLGTLDSGARVWTDPVEWFWGLGKWSALLGQTLLMGYVGTLWGAAFAFMCCASRRAAPRADNGWIRFAALRFPRILPHRAGAGLRARLRGGVRPRPLPRRAGARHPHGGRARQALHRGRGERRRPARRGRAGVGRQHARGDPLRRAAPGAVRPSRPTRCCGSRSTCARRP